MTSDEFKCIAARGTYAFAELTVMREMYSTLRKFDHDSRARILEGVNDVVQSMPGPAKQHVNRSEHTTHLCDFDASGACRNHACSNVSEGVRAHYEGDDAYSDPDKWQ